MKDFSVMFFSVRVSLLHGKMSSAEKNKTLSEFTASEGGQGLRVLVSTSIIEVGRGGMAKFHPLIMIFTFTIDRNIGLNLRPNFLFLIPLSSLFLSWPLWFSFFHYKSMLFYPKVTFWFQIWGGFADKLWRLVSMSLEPECASLRTRKCSGLASCIRFVEGWAGRIGGRRRQHRRWGMNCTV